MTRILAAMLALALAAAGIQTIRLARIEAAWAKNRAVLAEKQAQALSAEVERRKSAEAALSALRGEYDDIMEQADALPDSPRSGLDAGRVRLLNAIR